MVVARRLVIIVVLICSGIFYHQSIISQASSNGLGNGVAEEARQTLHLPAPTAPFTVRVEPQRHFIRPGESFEVRLQVINTSQVTQSFDAFSCSWSDHWQTDDPDMQLPGYVCGRNSLQTQTLEPGNVYEKKLSLKRISGKHGETVAFALGFTPHLSKRTYWSRKIVVQIEESLTADRDVDQLDKVEEGSQVPIEQPQTMPVRPRPLHRADFVDPSEI